MKAINQLNHPITIKKQYYQYMKFKKVLKWIGIVLLVFMGFGLIVYLKYLRPFMSKMKQTEMVQLDKNICIITGGGGNSGIINSDSLVVVVDTKMDDAADLLYKKVMEIAGTKPVLVINTHWHPDHVGGNPLFKNAGILAGGSYTEEDWKKEAGEKTLPNQWLKGKIVIPMGDDTLTVFNLAKNVHTSSDVMVYLHQHEILFGGDVILNKQAPVIMGNADGDAYIDVLNDLPNQMDIKTIVPGHGPIGGIEMITNFRDFFADMKLAASNPDKEKDLVAKYDSWNQLPIFMSPAATVSFFKKKNAK